MAALLLGECSSEELLQGQLALWNQTLSFFKPVALAVAVDLGIADTIHRLGGAATLAQIAAEAGINLNPRKLPALRRIMRALTVSGIFATVQQGGEEGPVYKLTAASRLLVADRAVLAQLFLIPCRLSAACSGLSAWFLQADDEQQPAGGVAPFALAFGGQTVWERAERDADVFPLDDAMASDTAFLMPILLRERGDELFGGLTSLVDVAGGLGGAAAAIAAAYPDLKCTVLDLPHVVAKAPSGANNVQYVGGDMFQHIPPADAVFLKIRTGRTDKWMLHDWSDDDCVKILKNCKKAIPPRAAGGKVIIIDMVVGLGSDSDNSSSRHLETQLLFDLLQVCINGGERDEQEWKKVFLEAGFQDYKIIPVLGVRSIIELYP